MADLNSLSKEDLEFLLNSRKELDASLVSQDICEKAAKSLISYSGLKDTLVAVFMQEKDRIRLHSLSDPSRGEVGSSIKVIDPVYHMITSEGVNAQVPQGTKVRGINAAGNTATKLKLNSAGYLVVFSDEDLSQPTLSLLLKYVEHNLTPSLKHAADSERNYSLAISDPLTGLYNTRHFRETLEREVGHVRGNSVPGMSLLRVDLDNFKQCNDKGGHAYGDAVLKGIGELLKQGRRKSDLVARVGGDEFGIILPQTQLEYAVAEAEEIRRKVYGEEFGKENGVRVTTSIGVAHCPSQATTPEDLDKCADKAAYLAKNLGRNKVEMYKL